ncbi:RNA polymerase III transcription initiation factor complex subunit [Scheffersomyces spartinae]|uniref:RNA polymerase III transcription initiation factor complex subunit n=1 Tax=Scheffersomyces spartinae TaxID=45513 RepID=A0A9P8AGC5_9ASCO|nr:RNA polymerase III transcription initiation factor complex subunit [Scheffersomyces spartinae]KAG7191559.1 RNA polymerase III transcription initiation factor complex subunit [Scheffersomyces spartinae]
MLGILTPLQLVSCVLEKLAFSGLSGLDLPSMWDFVGEKLKLEEVDGFLKQAMWQWLFFENTGKSLDGTHQFNLYILKDKKPVPILPDYEEFINEYGPESALLILPSQNTQWEYMTGIRNVSKKYRVQLGEFPFQLLCEIAKAGAQGVQSPELCSNTGQDPRSLPMRLRKLEELGLIKKMSIINEKKQHTNLCIHFKFAHGSSSSSQQDDDKETMVSRSIASLRSQIVKLTKDAPNHLRGFKDLRKEVGLDADDYSRKYYRKVIWSLHSQGYIERIMVQDTEEAYLTYSLRYIKDIPKDANAVEDYVNELDTDDEDLQKKAEEPEPTLYDQESVIPRMNLSFPTSNQIYNIIEKHGTEGITTLKLNKYMTGVTDNRPLTKLFDSITSYFVNKGTLEPLKKFKDAYPETSIVRSYDFEGKFKFYRYFSKSYSEFTEAGTSKQAPFVTSKKSSTNTKEKTLQQLNSELFQPLGKVNQTNMFVKEKKRSSLDKDLSATPPPKKRRTRAAAIISTDKIAEAALEAEIHGELPKSVAKSVNTSVTVTHEPSQVESVFNSQSERQPQRKLEPILVTDFRPAEFLPKTKSQKHNESLSDSGSMKGIRRREELIRAVIKLGGVSPTSNQLRQTLDSQLASTTVMDLKTLARDIKILVESGDLEVRDVPVVLKNGKEQFRKLLIVTDPEHRPSESKIQEVQDRLLDRNTVPSYYGLTKRIESKVTLFKTEHVRKKKGKGRLDTLDSLEVGLLEGDNMESGDIKRRVLQKNSLRRVSNKVISQLEKFDVSDVTPLLRAVVISKMFNKGALDFESIAELFANTTPKDIRSRWSTLRKNIGGKIVVDNGVEEFEAILLRAISEDLVTLDELENLDYRFMLDVWKDFDGSIVSLEEKVPLYKKNDINRKEYEAIYQSKSGVELVDRLEDSSMVQKEIALAASTFYWEPKERKVVPKDDDDLRSVMKAIFDTKEDEFSKERVVRLLSAYEDEDIRRATDALVKDREIVFSSSDDAEQKFSLTEKVYHPIDLKYFTPKFFRKAAEFANRLNDALASSKGLIVSQAISNGQMATVLQKLSQGELKIIRVEKQFKHVGYESRLIDRNQLSCDIVLFGFNGESESNSIPSINIPIGKPCSHIWLDMNGKIKHELWSKLVIAILYYALLRPSSSQYSLYNKFVTLLSVRDFNAVINWLVQSKLLNLSHNGDVLATDSWFLALGMGN